MQIENLTLDAAVFVLPLFLAIVALSWVMTGWLDRRRMQGYVASLGGEVLDVRWSPFGPGWFGEKSDRIYFVRYVDRESAEHEAYCKTGFWTGVYFTQDRITRVGREPATTMEQLEAENRRLREELARRK